MAYFQTLVIFLSPLLLPTYHLSSIHFLFLVVLIYLCRLPSSSIYSSLFLFLPFQSTISLGCLPFFFFMHIFHVSLLDPLLIFPPLLIFLPPVSSPCSSCSPSSLYISPFSAYRLHLFPSSSPSCSTSSFSFSLQLSLRLSSILFSLPDFSLCHSLSAVIVFLLHYFPSLCHSTPIPTLPSLSLTTSNFVTPSLSFS